MVYTHAFPSGWRRVDTSHAKESVSSVTYMMSSSAELKGNPIFSACRKAASSGSRLVTNRSYPPMVSFDIAAK